MRGLDVYITNAPECAIIKCDVCGCEPDFNEEYKDGLCTECYSEEHPLCILCGEAEAETADMCSDCASAEQTYDYTLEELDTAIKALGKHRDGWRKEDWLQQAKSSLAKAMLYVDTL